MFIKSLELSGYKRFALTNIKHFKITPKNKIQLILGSNGSGKSSLMSELSPLPGNINSFFKDGYKIIEILHNNSHFILKSIFSTTGNKFYFIKDGEELNTGRSVTVYKELCKQHFNVTQDVHELMTGYTKFHEMSTADRRNWFTKISDSDYTFALEYYQKLKDQLRDIQGAVKLNHSRLVQESEKLLSEKDYEKYQKEIKDLQELLYMLLDLKTPGFFNNDAVDVELNNYEIRLTSLSNKVRNLRGKFLNYEGFESVNDIELAIIDCKSTINSLNIQVQDLYEKINRDQQTLEVLNKTSKESITDVDNNAIALAERLESILSNVKLHLVVPEPREALAALMTVYENLTDIFTTLDSNENRKYTRDNFIKINDKKNALVQQLAEVDKAQFIIINKRKELEHFKIHNETECPKCKHVWHRGYSDETYTDILIKIEVNGRVIESLSNDILKADKDIAEMNEYFNIYKSYISITRSWPILHSLWEHLSNSDIIFNSPKQATRVLEDFKVDLNLCIQLEEIRKNLKDNEELKSIIFKNQELDLDKISIGIDEMNMKLSKSNTLLQSKKNYLTSLNIYRQTCIDISYIQKQIEDTVKSRSDRTDELIRILKKNALNDVIQIIQLELNKREQVISKINIQKALVENIESQLKDYNDTYEVLKLAVKELSPTEGLIAKGLTGFINHFVSQINSFIKKIWLYPLELKPIIPEEGETFDLDYKFSVNINDNIPISDISKASSAMKEVIDLAFKIVSMKYLNLDEAPIFLDEFSASFDKAHRESSFIAINNLITNNNFSQVFMISHYEHSYGSLKNCDITVLCPANIAIPRDTAFNINTVIS